MNLLLLYSFTPEKSALSPLSDLNAFPNNPSSSKSTKDRVSKRLMRTKISLFKESQSSTSHAQQLHNVDDPSSFAQNAFRPRQQSTSKSFSQGQSIAYLDLGDCDQICKHWHACFWYAERLKGLPENQRPKYSHCFKGGQVRLPLPRQPPEIIKELFKDRRFMENIRAYNMTFAMTSFGAKVDDSVNNGSGPYVFKQTNFINKPSTSKSATQFESAYKKPTVRVNVPLMDPATPVKASNELPKKQKKCVANSDENNKTHVGLEEKNE